MARHLKRSNSISAIIGIRGIMKRIIQVESWNPFETYLLVVSFIAGLAGLFFRGETSSVVANILPYWVLWVWYTGLTLGSLLGIVGVHVRFIYKLQVEMIGISILGSVSLGYALAVSIGGGRAFVYSVILVAFFSFACIARSIQLYKRLAKLEKAQEVIT